MLERSKKASLVGAFFICALQVAAPAQARCPGPDADVRSVRVERVIDGDTLHLADGVRVRLIGLNAPELGYRERPSQPFAQKARQALEALVRADGLRVRLVPGRQPRDRHGRLLAHAYDADGGSLEERLLELGLGYFVAIAPNLRLADCLAAAEARARDARRGLWVEALAQPAAALRQGGFQRVETRIVAFERNRGGLWLETADDLVLQVPPEARAAFDERALAALVGRRVEARGWVVERRRGEQARWLLPLGHPGMLQALP